MIGLVGLATWRTGAIDWLPFIDGPGATKTLLALPDKPSIAVLPFTNLSDDPQQEYFADGLTEDLITDLSKIQDLFVIARNSSFTYKGKPTKVQEVAADLGVQFVLEGSVRRTGDAVRINAQLIDALTGHHIWAERYEGTMTGIFDFQDQALAQIIANLSVELGGANMGLAEEGETDVVEAYDTFLKGWEFFRRRTANDNLQAIALFEQAIKLDPSYSRAYAALAASYWDRVNLNWELTHGIAWEHAFEKALTFVDKAMESPTSDSYRLLAEMLAMRGRHEEAVTAVDRAIALDPNNPSAYLSKAHILNVNGGAEEAEQILLAAMRLDPHYQPDYLRALGLSLFRQGRYQEAAKLLERAVSRQPDILDDYITLVAAYGHLGRLEKATAAQEFFDGTLREFGWGPMTIKWAGIWWYGDIFQITPGYRERLLDGLRKAGVPEGIGEPNPYDEFQDLITRLDNGQFSVQGATKIDTAAAKAIHERGEAQFIDVLPPGIFSQGHIPGALNLHLNDGLSKQRLAAIVGPNEAVVFSCKGRYCPWSAYACAKAITWGYTKVFYFAGGYPAWEGAGYPLESSVAH